ncbi:4Fe-4S binding protein [Candidatus Bipolaricaulota bacterium]
MGRAEIGKEAVTQAGAVVSAPALYKPEGEEKNKIRMYVARCTFCAQCVDACPVGALATTEEFLLADTDRFSENLIVE